MAKEIINIEVPEEKFTCNDCGQVVLFRTDLDKVDLNYENQGIRIDGLDHAFHFNCILVKYGLPKFYKRV